ncbi:MAG: hypothetical protein K2X94_01000 [Amoebophilaceae bacterium]|nr:hypothetical protein [Amoebophilaceae bacterium]
MKSTKKIIALALLYFLIGYHRSYALEITYATDDFSYFVQYAYQDKSLRAKVRQLHFKQYTYPDALLQLENFGYQWEEQQFFSDLLQVKQISHLTYALDNIADIEKKSIYTHLQQLYKNYQTIHSIKETAQLAHYAQSSHTWFAAHNNSLQSFLAQMACLYGVDPRLWNDTLTIIPYMVNTDDTNATIHTFYNYIFYPIQQKDCLSPDYARLIYTLCKWLYAKRTDPQKRATIQFFNRYPSPYAYFVGESFSHLLASGGATLFLNTFSPGGSIATKLQHYVSQKKVLDNHLYRWAIKQYKQQFPALKNEIKEVLQRCVLLHQDPTIARQWYKVLSREFHIHSCFYCTVDDSVSNRYDFDHNAPVILVIDKSTTDHINPLWKQLPRLKKLFHRPIQKIAKGLYIGTDKQDRRYLCFVIDHKKELKTLVAQLAKEQFFKEIALDYIPLRSTG